MKNDKIDIILTLLGFVASLAAVVLLLLFVLSENNDKAFMIPAILCVIVINVSNIVRKARLKKQLNSKSKK